MPISKEGPFQGEREADMLSSYEVSYHFFVSTTATKEKNLSSGCGKPMVASELASLNANTHLINI